MAFRGANTERCPNCRMAARVCVCDVLPQLDNRTPVVVIRHFREEERPTNTARVAERALARCQVVRWGMPDREFTAPIMEWPPLLLHPAASRTLCADDADRTLVVPDGTWRQTVRMMHRDAFLMTLPAARLPDDDAAASGPAISGLRDQMRVGHLSTCGAIARALGIVESQALEERLAAALRMVVERTLWARGRLSADRVTGGIPSG